MKKVPSTIHTIDIQLTNSLKSDLCHANKFAATDSAWRKADLT